MDKISVFENKINNDNKNLHLAKLYAIVYIKFYLFKLVYLMKEEKVNIENQEKIEKILDFFKSLSNNNVSKVIKIYIFKLYIIL